MVGCVAVGALHMAVAARLLRWHLFLDVAAAKEEGGYKSAEDRDLLTGSFMANRDLCEVMRQDGI